MGCNIHAYVEVKKDNHWLYYGETWDFRNYGIFGWLAGVRNYSGVTSLAIINNGLPNDISPEVSEQVEHWDSDGHTRKWVSLKDLLAVNYNEVIYDRRVTRQISANYWDGGCTTDDLTEAKQVKLADFLGVNFMKELEEMKTLGEPKNVRIVFWFDN